MMPARQPEDSGGVTSSPRARRRRSPRALAQVAGRVREERLVAALAHGVGERHDVLRVRRRLEPRDGGALVPVQGDRTARPAGWMTADRPRRRRSARRGAPGPERADAGRHRDAQPAHRPGTGARARVRLGEHGLDAVEHASLVRRVQAEPGGGPREPAQVAREREGAAVEHGARLEHAVADRHAVVDRAERDLAGCHEAPVGPDHEVLGGARGRRCRGGRGAHGSSARGEADEAVRLELRLLPLARGVAPQVIPAPVPKRRTPAVHQNVRIPTASTASSPSTQPIAPQ